MLFLLKEKNNIYIHLYQNDYIITWASVIKVFSVDMPYEWLSFNCGTNAPPNRVMTLQNQQNECAQMQRLRSA